MSYDDVLPPEPVEVGRTAWETEHLDDPADDGERYVEVRSLPAFDLSAAEWRIIAEGYRRERDHLRDQVLRLEDEAGELADRYYGRRR